MTRWLVLLSTLVTGCAEPVIELSLRMPGAANGGDFDTSCVSSIEVFAWGNDNENNSSDFTRDCIELDGPAATFADIRTKMLGNFNLRIPASGLESVEVYGRLGSCDPVDADSYPMDILFYGGAAYTGDDQLTIPLEGMLSCKLSPVTARPIDILKLTANPADCPAALLPDDADAFVDIGTISTTMYGPYWFGGEATFAKLAGGTAGGFMARMTTSNRACPAVSAYSGNQDTNTCVVTNTPLCPGGAGDGYLEVATMDWQVSNALIDPAKAENWDNVVVGAVWATTPTKGPVTGAKVTIDPELGEVQYVEPGAVVTRNLTTTGASGLFVLYTDSIVDVAIAGAGTSRNVKLGAGGDLTAISLVVLK